MTISFFARRNDKFLELLEMSNQYPSILWLSRNNKYYPYCRAHLPFLIWNHAKMILCTDILSFFSYSIYFHPFHLFFKPNMMSFHMKNTTHFIPKIKWLKVDFFLLSYLFFHIIFQQIFKHSCSNLEQTKTLFHHFTPRKRKKKLFQEIMCSLAWKTIMRVAFLSYDIIKKLSFLSVECKPISSDVISINTFKYSIKVLHSFSCSCEKATKLFKLSISRRVPL